VRSMNRSAFRLALAPFLLIATPMLVAAQSAPAASMPPAPFKTNCVMCHGSDGTGNTTMGTQLKATNLHSSEVHKLGVQAIKKVISEGKGNMPPFGGQLTDAEITQLAQYVHSLPKSKP
jgi:mono/diheme cytochrome c family protein